MKKRVKDLEAGEVYRSKRLGGRVRVVSVEQGPFGTYRVKVCPLFFLGDSFDWNAEVEVETPVGDLERRGSE